ncbi:MAG: molybdopterin-dependent oxidoreductase [Bacteroidota bacterium]
MKVDTYKTTCSYCGVGCGIIVKKDLKGKIKVEGDPDHPTNKGMLCSKGMNLHYVAQDTSDRILSPHMRGSRNHPLSPCSWDSAINRAAAVFSTLIKKFGPNSVGFYVSGQCLTEEYYLINKLVKGHLRTNNLDTNSRLCMSSAVSGYMKTFGEDIVPGSYEDIELSDCLLIAGANPAWCHPILFRRIEAHKAKHPQTKIIVVDPRQTATCSIADLHLQINPGTDVILYNAIARRLYEMRMIDRAFIDKHTEGFDQYVSVIFDTSVKKAARICGISVQDIRLAATYIGESKAFMSMWAMGLNQSVVGVDKNTALLNLSLITGQVGKPGAGPFSLTGQPNAMGGREVGGMSTLLAAHRDQSNPEHRQEVANFWKVPKLPEKPGLTATQMFEALETGELKAIWIVCTNPMVSLPNGRRMEAALKNARFVVVQDISYNSLTTQYADLLLPAAGWLEKDGTMTNSERRISYLPKVIDPPGEALPDAEIICRFAQAMGFPDFSYSHSGEVYDEHAQLTKGTHIDISGLNYQRLKKEGTFQWPVPYQDHEGTPRLFSDKKFYTQSGKAQINSTRYTQNDVESTSPQFPLILTTGRIRDQWHTMTKTGKVNKLLIHQALPKLEIHPVDAYVRNLKEKDIVVVKNDQGAVQVGIHITNTIKQGVVFLPMHWGKILNSDFGRANNLTSGKYDPVSKEPDYKYTAVEVKRYIKPTQKICVIGAGAAAYGFVKSYRELNKTDEIHVFSREEHPFYNRVLLPEYVSEHLQWEDLNKLKKGELRKMGVILHHATCIASIDRQRKELIDRQGATYTYNVLIGATGSRPIVPRDVPMHLPGVFTLRERQDADALKEYLEETGLPPDKQHVLVIGGGLLGLELAAALHKKDTAVTVIQRGSRLMERQLDDIGSSLLAENVRQRGIQVYFDNEVDTIFPTEPQNGLIATLKSGKIISCNAAIYAIGTRPNIELFKSSGINCGRGVIVDEHLQTHDPHVFAIGEIAEFNQKLFGITSAAEQQAHCLAKFIAGDLGSYYKGSVLMNILKFEDLSLCSIGDIQVPKNDPSYEEIIFTDISKGYYKKCIVKEDRLIGAILLGDKSEFAEFKVLIEDRIELSEKRDELLRSMKDSPPVKGKLLCACNHVGVGNLQEHIQTGVEELDELCKLTGAGLGCGSCKPEIMDIIQKAKSPQKAQRISV